uniref:Uncharacterized protein n=1 Tax=Arundo donax TaxID=35708 RepID=A0A0A9TE51_ARUDO
MLVSHQIPQPQNPPTCAQNQNKLGTPGASTCIQQLINNLATTSGSHRETLTALKG